MFCDFSKACEVLKGCVMGIITKSLFIHISMFCKACLFIVTSPLLALPCSSTPPVTTVGSAAKCKSLEEREWKKASIFWYCSEFGSILLLLWRTLSLAALWHLSLDFPTLSQCSAAFPAALTDRFHWDLHLQCLSQRGWHLYARWKSFLLSCDRRASRGRARVRAACARTVSAGDAPQGIRPWAARPEPLPVPSAVEQQCQLLAAAPGLPSPSFILSPVLPKTHQRPLCWPSGYLAIISQFVSPFFHTEIIFCWAQVSLRLPLLAAFLIVSCWFKAARLSWSPRAGFSKRGEGFCSEQWSDMKCCLKVL